MKTAQMILTALLGALLLNPLATRAEDIDIYSGLTGTSNIPNVMLIIDSASNSNAQMSACTYWDGGIPTGSSQGTKSLDNYMCALDTIVHGMSLRSDGSALVKLGITTMAGVYLRLTPVDNQPYTGTFPGTSGRTNRQAISIAIRALTTVSGSANQGAEFQETWAYYTGGNGGSTGTGILSNVSYSGTNAVSGCQKNYNIFMSGVTNSAHSNTLAAEKTVLDAAVDLAVTAGSITAAQGTTLKTQIAGNGESPWAWEWSRFMFNNDNISTAAGTQNIITYSVAAGSPVHPAAMGSMEKYIWGTANYGGGKYFAATSYQSIVNSILKILNEVQAVNSVFASSSLPVSVNAQGTFLNQIYMGMFRPDANGQPRWVGNLKQYQFGYDTATRELSLVDSLGDPALSSAGTGFISPNAISFWTSKNTAAEPDLNGGFWRNQPLGAGLGFDHPDGEMVEKGGSAQVLRKANLLNDYTTAAGTSTNPRKVYTYCPTGSSCVAALTNSANAFALSNTDITASMFGASNITVSSIVRTGTTALVTTNTPHGYSTGDSVTISGATQSEYNVTQNVTMNSATTFTITGLPDYPNTPNTGTYSASLPGLIPQAISGVSVATSTTANTARCASGTIPNINCNQVTVTLSGHGYSNGNSITITGVSPAAYSGTFVIGNVTTNTFTYNVPVTPHSPSVNAYAAQLPTPAPINITSIATLNGANKTTVTANNSFIAWQSVTISGSSVAALNGTYTIASPTGTSFKITTPNGTASCASNCGTVVVNQTVRSIAAGNISRASVTATTATASGITASAFTNGQTVILSYVSGAGTRESEYAPLSGSRSVVITCTGTCTSFTFPITTSPSTTLTTSSPTATLVGIPAAIPAGAITRSGTTATVTGVANSFISGASINISVSGSTVGTETAYVGTWTISCPVSCSTAFTFGPVTLTPTTPATGTISAFSASAPPNRTTLINWVRGQDNLCDEKSPETSCTKTTINIRPSLHGDVLHSRPTVINYGGTIGVVVFYGANDSVYRAVNGNQTNPAGSTLPVPGSELWSFIPRDFFGSLTRMRDNSPLLQLPSTPGGIVPTPRRKDYFIDGSSSVYQTINTNGTTNTAYLYLAMRRGGTFFYALDVTVPTSPTFLWKISNTDTDFAELGQTWSQPKVVFVRGYANPVLIFGAGYDPAGEDVEPPVADSMGRGIFAVDAVTGAMVWRASYGVTAGCSGTTTKASCTLPEMKYSIPADITLLDHTGNDGYVDRLYAADLGGNIWRVDLEPTAGNTPDNWKVTKLASLGCVAGVCASGVTPRKFFYAPDVVPTSSYNAVLIGSGDREHPLYTDAAYNKINRFYMIKDTNTGNEGTDLNITQSTLVNNTPVAPATSATYDGTQDGYYITLGTGEKVVNAPLTVAGYTYFGTNTPATPSSNSCTSNLGTARGYQVAPLLGTQNSVIYDGGGLPPSPVAGSVIVNVNGTDMVLPFCIGCGGAPDDTCRSALCGATPPITVSTSRSRTYWYKQTD